MLFHHLTFALACTNSVLSYVKFCRCLYSVLAICSPKCWKFSLWNLIKPGVECEFFVTICHSCSFFFRCHIIFGVCAFHPHIRRAHRFPYCSLANMLRILQYGKWCHYYPISISLDMAWAHSGFSSELNLFDRWKSTLYYTLSSICVILNFMSSESYMSTMWKMNPCCQTHTHTVRHSVQRHTYIQIHQVSVGRRYKNRSKHEHFHKKKRILHK